MTAPTLKLYPTAPLKNKNDDLEHRFEKRCKYFQQLKYYH